MYIALTGEKTLRHFWRESPGSLMYLAERVRKKHRQQAEEQLLADAETEEE